MTTIMLKYKWTYGENKSQKYWEAKPKKGVTLSVIQNKMESEWFCIILDHDACLLLEDKAKMESRSAEKCQLQTTYMLRSKNAEEIKQKAEYCYDNHVFRAQKGDAAVDNNNIVQVVTREDSIDLNHHMAISDSAVKANKAFKKIAENILNGEDTDENGTSLEEALKDGYCVVGDNSVSFDTYELNNMSELNVRHF